MNSYSVYLMAKVSNERKKSKGHSGRKTAMIKGLKLHFEGNVLTFILDSKLPLGLYKLIVFGKLFVIDFPDHIVSVKFESDVDIVELAENMEIKQIRFNLKKKISKLIDIFEKCINNKYICWELFENGILTDDKDRQVMNKLKLACLIKEEIKKEIKRRVK